MKPASTAYLLISHGSRDPRPQAAMDELAAMVRSQLAADTESLQANAVEIEQLDRSYAQKTPSLVPAGYASSASDEAQIAERDAHGEKASLDIAAPELLVETACLELSPIPLHEQIYNFAQQVMAAGIQRLKLLPIFLMPGVHVKEDIPAEIEVAREMLGNRLELVVCPHIGSHPKLSDVLSKRLATVSSEGSLLIAHGSRRPKGNRAIQAIARKIQIPVAYWSTAPDIETQVIELMHQGYQKLTILPYFLFAGGITDAIIHRTEELAERFPKVQFRLLPTLGATHEMANLAVELIKA